MRGRLGLGRAEGGFVRAFRPPRRVVGFERSRIEFVCTEMRLVVAGPGSGVRGRKSFVQKRRMAGRGSGSRVRGAGGCVRVRVAWRALGDRIESLALCHEPAAESRAVLTGR